MRADAGYEGVAEFRIVQRDVVLNDAESFGAHQLLEQLALLFLHTSKRGDRVSVSIALLDAQVSLFRSRSGCESESTRPPSERFAVIWPRRPAAKLLVACEARLSRSTAPHSVPDAPSPRVADRASGTAAELDTGNGEARGAITGGTGSL